MKERIVGGARWACRVENAGHHGAIERYAPSYAPAAQMEPTTRLISPRKGVLRAAMPMKRLVRSNRIDKESSFIILSRLEPLRACCNVPTIPNMKCKTVWLQDQLCVIHPTPTASHEIIGPATLTYPPSPRITFIAIGSQSSTAKHLSQTTNMKGQARM